MYKKHIRFGIVSALLSFIMLMSSVNVLGASESKNSKTETYAKAGDELTQSFEGTAFSGENGAVFKEVYSNQNFSLCLVIDGENKGEFCVRDLRGGKTWYSNPQNRYADTETKGAARFETYSQFVLNVYDSFALSEGKINSYVGSKNGADVTLYQTKNGFKAIYKLATYKIEVPLYVSLSDKGVEITTSVSEIKEKGTAKILDISLVPYFGCASDTDQGYMFVPDGSGALIDFNNGRLKSTAYNAKVYGNDPTFSPEIGNTAEQSVRLPVFGFSYKDGGLLGVIGAGQYDAKIMAYTCGMYNRQNTVYTCFNIRAQDVLVIGNSANSTTKKIIKYDLDNLLNDQCTVTYYPLLTGESGYSGMAHCYQDYLLSNGLEKKSNDNNAKLFLELYGGIYKQSTFMGIPMQRFKKLTNLENAQQISKDFCDDGENNTIISLRNWSTDILQNKLQTKYSIDTRLGSEKQLNALNKLTENQVYLEYSPMMVSKNGNGFISSFNAAKRVSNSQALIYRYKLSTGYLDKSIHPDFLVKAPTLEKSGLKFMKSAAASSVKNVVAPTYANTLYSDFQKKHFCSRTTLAQTVIKVLGSSKGKLVLNEPNAYALNYADFVSSVPSGSSEYDIEDETVPFYQLVLSGLIPYSSSSLNCDDVTNKSVLKTLETGSVPQFTFAYDNLEELIQSEYSYLYAIDYKQWKDQALSINYEVQQAFQNIGSHVIVSHSMLAPNVYATVYQNGKVVIVNYGLTAVQTEFGIVQPESYLLGGKAKS